MSNNATDKVIQFGVIGPGRIARQFADAVSRYDGAKIVAVASRSAERGEEYAKEFGVPKIYTDYEEMMKDPTIDAVYVAVPHIWHCELAIMAMRYKKAVLCEKPAAINLAQAEKMVAVAKEEGVLFVEALWTRFLPATLKAHEWVEAGKIGDVELVQSNFGENCEYTPDSRMYHRELAGGAILDLGIYVLGFALDFGKGALRSFSGQMKVGKTKVDETTTVQLAFEGGTLAYGSCGMTAKTCDDGNIYGTKGMIKLPSFWHARDAYLYNEKNELVEVFHDDQTEGFYYEVEHFTNLWRVGKVESPRMPWSETLRAANIYDTLLKENDINYV